jgi:hypothetical protein
MLSFDWYQLCRHFLNDFVDIELIYWADNSQVAFPANSNTLGLKDRDGKLVNKFLLDLAT